MDAQVGREVAGPKTQAVRRIEAGREEGDPANMIEMGVAAENLGIDGFLLGEERAAQPA